VFTRRLPPHVCDGKFLTQLFLRTNPTAAFCCVLFGLFVCKTIRRQIPAKFLKTGSMLAKALKNALEPKAEKITTTQDLRNKCLDKDACGLFLKGSKVSPKYAQEAIKKLVVEYPKVTFAAVDSSVLYVKGVEAEFLQELVPGMPRFIVFKKTSGTTDKSKTDGSRLKTTAVALDVDVAYGPMSNLVASVMSGSATMSKVSTTPTIKTRTKKLEKTENEKRQRRKNRESGGGSSSSSSGGGSHTGENDGSAAGRKAERERRRAEHRKKNPNYREKTPEEIKEMERQRRIRMEEEAKKWNMAPEDADPDGGEGAGSEYVMDEDWDGDEEQDLDFDEEEEDDEDVMDLD